MKKTIGIFAHVDGGKTTLSEALLFRNGAIRKRGSIEEKNTAMDTTAVERERGITCFSGACGFRYCDNEYYLIDTPGHTDFLPDTERCMSALDAAILLVSAVEGIESNTELLWELLKEKNIPVFIFINKCDRDTADPKRVAKELLQRFGAEIHQWHSPEYIEAVASFDDALMERFFEGTLDNSEADRSASALVTERKLFPCIFGSALKGEGIDELMCCIDSLLLTDYKGNAPLEAEIFKVRREKDKRAMLVHIRRGGISVRDTLPNGERVSELRVFDGTKTVPVNKISAGDVAEIYGSYEYRAGDCIGKEANQSTKPGLVSRVIYPPDIPSNDMLAKLKLLEDEEPCLSVRYEGQTGEISVSVMGRIQLEILQQRIGERFGIRVEFGKCEVVYKETLADTTVGYGHFEPLRHYSEVHLRLEPMPRNSGIEFASQCSLNTLTSNYQNLIRTHVFEKEHRGTLIGAPLTDVKITLLVGASHEKHTEGGDFRESTYRAVRQGLMKAKMQLLEPYYRCRFVLSHSEGGRVMSDITKMCGTLISTENIGESTELVARIPVSEFIDYQSELASFTKGRGRVIFAYDGYDICHNEAEVVERYGYNAERDTENTADSVFCAHGAGFNVPWYEVEKYIHCK